MFQPTASGDQPDQPGTPTGDDHASHLVVETARPALKQPPLYQVVLLNDDFTPMDFVVEVLEHFFGLNREAATRVMLTVHTRGKAGCGTYTRDVAETKATQVVDYARRHQHPLMATTEPV